MHKSPINAWLKWLVHTRHICRANSKTEMKNVSTLSEAFIALSRHLGSSWELFTVLTFQNMENFCVHLPLTLTKIDITTHVTVRSLHEMVVHAFSVVCLDPVVYMYHDVFLCM